jgi:hypothetical protein
MSNETAKRPVVIKEYLRYEFSEEELRGKSKQLALSIQLKTQAQEEQKAAASQFKERIESADAQIGKLSRDINSGWEMRNVDCQVQFHTPTVGAKTVVRLDTGEIVKESAMLQSELQENLFSSDNEAA